MSRLQSAGGRWTATLAGALAATLVGAVVLAAEPIGTGNPSGTVPLGPSPLDTYSNLPDMGSTANSMLSRGDEYQVGRMMVHNLRDEAGVLEDPESTEYINNLGQSIAAQAQEGTHSFSFFIVRDPSVNAFAVPGGFIGTNYGLILLTTSEAELGGVLAHEIGHVVQRHIARAIHAQSRQNLSTMAAMLGAILIGVAAGGEAAPGLLAMAQGTAMQQQINFTRMEEIEADHVGINFLSAAGYDPNGVAAFFSAMGRHEGVQLFSIPAVLLNHPVTTERIAEARARAALLPRPTRSESVGYALIRERLRVLTAAPETDMRIYYEKLRANGVDTLANRYGQALADVKGGDAKSAVATLKTLVAENPGITILHSALGEAQMAAGQQEAALATFAHAISLFPRNIPVTVRYAETLMKAGQPGKAHKLLLDLFNTVEPTPDQIRLTALAASAAGETGDAYYYMAEYHVASGNLMLATQQLDLALAEPHLNDVQRKRYYARREEIRDYLREQRQERGGSASGESSGGSRRGGRS